MSKLKHIEIPEGVYFVTTNTVNNEPYFERDDFAQIVRDCLLFQRIKERIYLYAYVIMPSHLHIIFRLGNKWTLGQVMQSIKGNSAYKITHFHLRNSQPWIGPQECGPYANYANQNVNVEDSELLRRSRTSRRVGIPADQSTRRVGIPADQSSVVVYPTLRSVWQKNYYDHVIRNEKDFEEKWHYIYNNPVSADLVDRPQKYRWSSFYKYAPEIDAI